LSETIQLLPAQITFLQGAIPGYRVDQWQHSIAGYAGSDRRFVRVQPPAGAGFILIIWDSADKDWDRFLALQRDFAAHSTLLPGVFASDPQHGLILEEDLGAETLKAVVTQTPGSAELWYQRVMDALVGWHDLVRIESPTLNARRMDEEMFLWETSYFMQHCVTEFCGQERLLDQTWEDERRQLAREASRLTPACMHRDFQSENIMIHQNQIRFIDFQGARLGPVEYDLASLLFDPYTTVLDSAMVYRLLTYYQTQSGRRFDRADFHRAAMQRLMQALGAFGNLSIHRGKRWYQAFIPIALSRLEGVCRQESAYPAITAVVRGCLASVADFQA
jgi:aminoglycoside/choline kinase family phosphotransferase